MYLREVLCTVCAVVKDQKVIELRLEPSGKKNILNNIYVGQVEKIATNIQAAFVRLNDSVNGYLPLNQCEHAIFADGHREGQPLRPGDQILIQINRDAMKGKLPALTANLNFSGKFLVLTTGNRKIGISNKLSKEESSKLSKWLDDERNIPDRGYGLIARTNAADASKEEFFHELDMLKKQYEKVAVYGRNSTCFSLLYESEPFYLSAVRDIYGRDLDEIVTDISEMHTKISDYLNEFQPEKLAILNLYQDKLLPLYKLHSLENAIDEICHEKIWLKSGVFLVIQQTEAFVSIVVIIGKYTGKKKAEETYRKINLEAAAEIARQLRLRNLSGIIVVDFINMDAAENRKLLMEEFASWLKRDPIKTTLVDMTALEIVEVTRKKLRKPLLDQFLPTRNPAENKSTNFSGTA